MMKRTLQGYNDSDKIVVRLHVCHMFDYDLPGLLILLSIAPSLLTCSTDSKDDDVGTVHVYNQCACVLI